MKFIENLCEIEKSNISSSEKVKQIKSIILDVTNEMEAKSENMHPEINHDLAKKLSLAEKSLRKVQNHNKRSEAKTSTSCQGIRSFEAFKSAEANAPYLT
jgi:hypothetical protein